MGFQGQLSSVSLTDIFQTLNMNRQTGTLSVSGPVTTVHVYFDQGQITMCSAPMVNGRPFLLDALVHKGQLAADKVDELVQQMQAGGAFLREIVLSSSLVPDYELDEMCAWCIEELVCPIFEWQQGDFSFTDGPPVAELTQPDTVTMGGAMVQTTQLIMEASRRMDEWKRIREVIPDPDALYVVDDDGRANLKSVQTDPEMLKVLRFLDGRHTLDTIAVTTGVTRFDTFAIVAQLVLAMVARPKTSQEIVADAVALRDQGEPAQAKDMLENALRQTPIPEVMRPLAECCVAINQTPRAVELYLELIQVAQDQGDLQTALADIETVIKLSPDDPDLLFERAQVQHELGQVEAAAASYTTAAQAYLARRDVPRSLDACHRAKNLLPRAPEPHRFLAKAYLLEGQTENAIVEYKALWHALLSNESPRQAIETLKGMLDTDCKYNSVKEQVLGYAQSTEAIKTSNAYRMLAYVAIIVLVLLGLGGGWWYIKTTVIKGHGMELVDSLSQSIPKMEQDNEHESIKIKIQGYMETYGSDPEIKAKLDRMLEGVNSDYNERAHVLFNLEQSQKENNKFDDAVKTLTELKHNYPLTVDAAKVDSELEKIAEQRISNAVIVDVKKGDEFWAHEQWKEALAQYQKILARQDLPHDMREALVKTSVTWNAQMHDAKALYDRADRMEKSGRYSKHEILDAFKWATTGDGQTFADQARVHVHDLELSIAHELGRLIQQIAGRGEDQQAFALLDELSQLANDATGHDVRDYYTALELPYRLQIDNQNVVLTIRRAGADDATVTSKERGGWTYQLTYRVAETVKVTASRTGFSPQVLAISTQGRITQSTVTLLRGPRWRQELTGTAVTRPVVAGKFVLLGTDHATIEVVDPVLGSNRNIPFPNTVAEFRSEPFVLQDRAYVVMDDHVTAIDLNSRVTLWSWPDEGALNLQLSGGLWIQEHDIKPGELLGLLATNKGGLIPFEVDGQGHVRPYQALDVGSDITGAPFIDHPDASRSILYEPAGTSLNVYDVSSFTDAAPPKLIYSQPARQDILGRPVRAQVAVGNGQRQAILISDSSGTIIALDAEPTTPLQRRVLGSWGVGGTSPTAPVVRPGKPVAYVAIAEGQVVALDLQHPGQPLWRFPAQNGIGQIAGAPVIGQHAVYVADANGILHALDFQTGAERWRADLGSPAVVGLLAWDGRVFVPTRSGHLVCFEEGDE
jgi:outer membrane protein assembly factor BamB/tetratricopeptide (TPR) repeat protein